MKKILKWWKWICMNKKIDWKSMSRETNTFHMNMIQISIHTTRFTTSVICQYLAEIRKVLCLLEIGKTCFAISYVSVEKKIEIISHYSLECFETRQYLHWHEYRSLVYSPLHVDDVMIISVDWSLIIICIYVAAIDGLLGIEWYKRSYFIIIWIKQITTCMKHDIFSG